MKFPYDENINEYGVVEDDDHWIGVIYQIHKEFVFDSSDFHGGFLGLQELKELMDKIQELNASIDL